LPVTEKAEPISHVKILINDDETVEIDSRAQQIYYINEVNAGNDAAMKCKSCKMVTIQEQYEFDICSIKGDRIQKRVNLCTSCGQFGQ
jgi:hypothetical protein